MGLKDWIKNVFGGDADTKFSKKEDVQNALDDCNRKISSEQRYQEALENELKQHYEEEAKFLQEGKGAESDRIREIIAHKIKLVRTKINIVKERLQLSERRMRILEDYRGKLQAMLVSWGTAIPAPEMIEEAQAKAATNEEDLKDVEDTMKAASDTDESSTPHDNELQGIINELRGKEEKAEGKGEKGDGDLTETGEQKKE